MNLIFDIETDGLEATKVHCIVAREWCGQHVYHFHDHGAYDGDLRTGVEFLRAAQRIIGHNIVGYDLPVLRDLHGFEPSGEVYDTMASARFWMPDEDLKVSDRARENFPDTLFGRHSLEAWGARLGQAKMPSPEDWSEFTEDMAAYCAQDVEVTYALYARLQEAKLPEEARAREQRFYAVMHRLRQHGVVFREDAALKLVRELQRARAEVNDAALRIHPGWTIEYVTPKRKERKTKFKPFNPNSRQQVAQYLQEKGWKPREYTDTGQPKVSEKILKGIAKRIPEAAVFSRQLLIQKRLGQLVEGPEALLGHVTAAGRIHGYVSHNGATTGRCTHSHPNLAQVPRVTSLYGPEFRALFGSPPGGCLLGVDMKGLELRTLAHYLQPYDGGRFIKVVTEGDPHTENQRIAGLATRDNAKTLIYGMMYGAGDAKLGKIVGGSRQQGARLRGLILDGIVGFRALVEAILAKVKRTGTLRGLDGRVLRVRHEHASLNTLLQSAGAILMKEFAVLVQDMIDSDYPGSAFVVLQAHDELQLELVDRSLADEVRPKVETLATQAGLPFNFRCPLACDARVGETWAETH